MIWEFTWRGGVVWYWDRKSQWWFITYASPLPNIAPNESEFVFSDIVSPWCIQEFLLRQNWITCAGKISCEIQSVGNLTEDAAFSFMRGLNLTLDTPLHLDHDRDQIYKLCGGNIGLMKSLIDNADIYGSVHLGLALSISLSWTFWPG